MVEKQMDVVALGELLIDFTQNGLSGQGNFLMEANPGGAPCNVLAMLTRLGKKTAFIGKVGDDFLGHHLQKVVSEVGIDTTGLKFDSEIPTTLAFVHNYENGDREFSFYRKPGADVCLCVGDIDRKQIEGARIFHFGSLSMTQEPVLSATKEALEIAKQSGCMISFDPNLRESLWDSLDRAHEMIDFGMQYCDILKISDNEIQWFTGKEDFDEGIQILKDKYNIPLILLSMGPDGSRAYYKGMRVTVAPFLQKNTIETTGAGDTFGGCCINYILEHGLDNLSEENLKEMLTFANGAASIITTRKGALRVMPQKDEVLSLINK